MSRHECAFSSTARQGPSVGTSRRDVRLHNRLRRVARIVIEHARGGDDDERRHHAGHKRPEKRVDLAELDVADVHSLVDHGALLEENLPGRDRRANVGHDQRDHRSARQDAAQRRVIKALAHGGPAVRHVARLHGPDGRGNVDQVEQAKEERDLLERPVLPRHHDREQQERHAEEGRPLGNAEQPHRLRHADVLGHQRQPVDQRQVEDGEPPPERPEGVENGFRVAALGDGPQADRHFLDVVGHRHEEDEGPKQGKARLRAGLGVGRNPAGVVVRHHGDDAGPKHRQQDERPPPQPAQRVKTLADPIHDSLGQSKQKTLEGSASRARQTSS